MINTKRLIIKPLSYHELKKLIESPDELAADLGLTPSLSLTEQESREAIINDMLPHMTDSSKIQSFRTMWIVIEKFRKAIIGGICFHGEPDNNGEVEIGYGIDKTYQNNGYMTETITGLIKWVRKNKKVKKIIAETDIANIPSVRVLEKNGFKIFQQNEDAVILKLEMNK